MFVFLFICRYVCRFAQAQFRLLVRGAFLLLGFGNRRDELSRPPPIDGVLGRLTGFIQLPMATGILVWRV